ncbi:hypothetical protein NKDENANG_01353 [Candidatus Entotheonellaceae bacterium PAL068K]
MNVLQDLGTREKIFVTAAVVAIVLALLFTLVLAPFMAHSARLDRQIVAAGRQRQELHTLQRDYRHQKAILDSIKARLDQQKNFAVFSRLEEIAGQAGMRGKILYMKPTVSTPSEAYEEEAVEIKMEGVTLEQLVNYLQQVENSPQFITIKRLYIKPRFDNRQLLTAIFRVSTFKPKKPTS